MKHFNFFIVLVLLTVLATSLGFAGKETGVKAKLPGVTQADQRLDRVRSDSDVPDVPEGRIQKISKRVNVSTATASPKPKKLESALAVVPPGILAGDYHIPSAFPFDNIEHAVGTLNTLGISNDVTFILDNPSYTENPVTFGDFGKPVGKTVTIKPATGVDVTITFVSTDGDGKGFAFNGANNITIDGSGGSLSLEYTGAFPYSDPFAATIYFTGASHDIAIKNTSIKGQMNNAVWASSTDGRPAVFSFAADADANGVTDIILDGCTITGASYGMKFLTEGYWDGVDVLTVKNCKIGGAYGDPVIVGALVEIATDVIFDNNIFDGVKFLYSFYLPSGNNTTLSYTEYDFDAVFAPGARGASFLHGFGQSTFGHFLLVDRSVFSNNIFRNISTDAPVGSLLLGYGCRVYTYNLGYNVRAKMYNNRFYNLTFTNETSIAAIRGPAGDVYHNSIQLLGTTAGASTTINQATYIYNNALSNEITGGLPSNRRGITNSGTLNNNAIHSTGYYVSGAATMSEAAAINISGVLGLVNFTSDLHIDLTGSSSASNIGKAGVLNMPDIDSEPRDITPSGVRDAGADEFATIATPFGPDVIAAVIVVPPASAPTGVPQIPIVTISNNSATEITIPFDVELLQTAGTGSYISTKQVTLLPMETKNVIFDNWKPDLAGSYTLQATTKLTGDINAGNDVTTKGVTVIDPIAVSAPKTYTWDLSAEGWSATTGPSAITDWKRKNNFTKLSGPKSGYSWVTERPNLVSTYTTGQYASTSGYAAAYPGPNLLTSPWLDISALGGTTLYISLDHSMKTEPGWDISWLRYTTDGLTWHPLGKLNDPKGVNIYNQSVYEYADVIPDAIDQATMIMYGLITDPLAHIATWSSNGGATATGPYGWVYAQLRINTGDYTPEIVGSKAIRFRYVAFSDAGGTEDPGGWAVDNFAISNTAPVFTGNTITGTAYEDMNGNGQFDGTLLAKGLAAEPIVPNVDVFLTYFGVPLDTEKTDANGVFTFLPPSLGGRVNLPGTYQVRFNKPGYVWTQPAGFSGIADVICPSNGDIMTQNLGYYLGFVSGIKFNDRYDDSLYTPVVDPPLSGWTIEVHKDSANGPLIGSAVSGVDGKYSVPTPPYYWGGTNPGNYVVKEVARPTIGRQTYPWNPSKNYTVTVTGQSGSPTAGVTDINFGNFVFGVITCEAVQDRNGNGVRELADNPAIPLGTSKVYIDVFKNQVKIATDTLGDGNSPKVHRMLEAGIYGFKRMNAIPTGHIETAPASANPPSPTDVLDSITVVVDTCGTVKSASFLYFQLLSVTGLKFEDKDGSSSFTGGDLGADGWTINVSGSVYGSASAVTHDGGNYTISDVGPGSHTVSETMLNADWVQTFPATPGTYTFTAITGSQGGNQTAKNFGNFKKFCVSGIKFRDRNCDGIQDVDEEPLANFTMNLTGKTPIVTGEDGTFEWCGLLPGSYTLSESPTEGWTASTPPAGTITFSGISGDAKVVPFGNCKAADNTKYRTFTYEQLRECDQQAKQNPPAMKPPTVSKPWYAPHLVGDLVRQIMATELAVLVVGEKDKTYPWGKLAAWLEPAKFGDVSATLVKCVKGVGTYHIGASQPFNTYGSSVMSKRYKKILPTKKSDMLIAELLTLQVNLAASDKGNTPTGLGVVIYPRPGPWGTTATIDAIEAYGNKIMTNWAAGMVVPQPVNPTDYDALYTAVREINLAFASTSVVDTTPTGGWRSSPFKLQYVGIKTALEAGFLAPTAAPKVRPVGTPEVIPDVYALGQNYPNPFNPTTTLSFELPSDAVVTLTIYNLLGQEVATVLDRQEYSAGTYEEYFDASQLASGVYLYRIVAEQIGDDGSTGQSFTQVKKMVLMK